MNPHIVAAVIYIALGALHVVSVHGMTYRLLFVDRKFRRCDEHGFFELLMEGAGRSWDAVQSKLASLGADSGWLAECSNAKSPSSAAAISQEVSQQADAYLDVLRLATGLASLLGLLGTVAGFLVADDVNNVALSTAFRTTLLGIAISIPPTIYLALTSGHRKRIQEQIETTQQLLVGLADGRSANSTVDDVNRAETGEMQDRWMGTAPPVQSPSDPIPPRSEWRHRACVQRSAIDAAGAAPAAYRNSTPPPPVRPTISDAEVVEMMGTMQDTDVVDAALNDDESLHPTALPVVKRGSCP